MMDSVASLSPVRADFFPTLDDGGGVSFDSSNKRRSSALFGTLTRHLTTTFSRVALDDTTSPTAYHHHTEASLRQVKMNIVLKNPIIYQMFRDCLIDTKCYTHYTACFRLQQFLDNVLRIPDLTDDIVNHRIIARSRAAATATATISAANSTAATRGGGSGAVSLFAYLMASDYAPHMSTEAKKTNSAESVGSTATLTPESVKQEPISLSEALANCSLNLPSLDGEVEQTDDHCGNESFEDEIESCGSDTSSLYSC